MRVSALINSRPTRSAAALLASLALAACSGAGTHPSTGVRATLNFKVSGSNGLGTLQHRSRMSKKINPKYVSQATNGIALWVWPSSQQEPQNPTLVADVSAASPYCTVATDGSGDRLCAIPVNAPVGQDDFQANGYDQVPSGGKPAGNLMESGTILNQTIVAGQGNQINLTFDGQIASLAMSPAWIVSQDDGISHTSTFAVNGLDADGYTIIDVTPFNNPLTVGVTNDPNSTLAITPPAQGSDPRLYSVTYNGGNLTAGQINASASGVSGSVTLYYTPMITQPQTLTIKAGNSATFTTSLATPPNAPAQGDYVASVLGSVNFCFVAPLFQAPPANGDPVTWTVSISASGAGSNCSVDVISPGPLYATQTVAVKITH